MRARLTKKKFTGTQIIIAGRSAHDFGMRYEKAYARADCIARFSKWHPANLTAFDTLGFVRKVNMLEEKKLNARLMR
ncbi:MAG: hypothetical protein NC102_09215 [Clostridium sp.]|nr:hypothetical protein [Clostridium sp.]